METPGVSDALRLRFQERSLAVVNRGIGRIMLGPTSLVEVEFGGFYRGEIITDEHGDEVILWTDIMLGEDNVFCKKTETEREEPAPRPTLASEDVIRRYMIEDMRQLITPEQELGASILLDYLMRWQEAEDLGLLTVADEEIIAAIDTMDQLISDHDAKRA